MSCVWCVCDLRESNLRMSFGVCINFCGNNLMLINKLISRFFLPFVLKNNTVIVHFQFEVGWFIEYKTTE